MGWLKKNLMTILLVTILLAGVGLLLYPTVSDYWNSFHQSKAVVSYVENVTNIDDEQYEKLWNDAVAYNEKLAENGIQWTLTDEEKEEYSEYLKVDDSGIMAYIDIPVIDCSLPIYHGTDESVLQIAIGHIEGSSLPVGGEGSHCVVSGHRGLPSARIFTDLDKLVEGDIFLIHTLDATLTYEVDQIRIVEPTDLSDLQIEEGKDDDAVGRLTEGCLPKILDFVQPFIGQGVASGDLVQEANLILFDYIQGRQWLKNTEWRDKIRRGSKEDLQSVLHGMMDEVRKKIQNQMRVVLTDQNQENDVSRQIVYQVNRVSEAAKRFREEHGRKVTPDELAKAMHVNPEVITQAIEFSGSTIPDIEMKATMRPRRIGPR